MILTFYTTVFVRMRFETTGAGGCTALSRNQCERTESTYRAKALPHTVQVYRSGGLAGRGSCVPPLFADSEEGPGRLAWPGKDVDTSFGERS